MNLKYNNKTLILNSFQDLCKIVLTRCRNHRNKFKAGRFGLVFLLLFPIPLILIHTGCKKLIEVDAPATSINEANVYTDDATATAVLTGIYTQMSRSNSSGFSRGFTSLSLCPSLSADE